MGIDPVLVRAVRVVAAGREVDDVCLGSPQFWSACQTPGRILTSPGVRPMKFTWTIDPDVDEFSRPSKRTTRTLPETMK